ncbi:hypothetical protein EHI8A_246680 [Entamoeba histolytica HM-1:IMSS-B]|uniref:PHD-type domain-containing protein n=5 Tax=Entamoeba histolytica TaxID=5759 RepID=C4LYS5_ENTH1|nr:hypothetical protein EHI_010270 [Entamoeba histolytica HM-1:IMSS]EMD42867.1 Hypothetical protein EHI5A_255060 [Entamoeba histolytica KU27]EMH74856.1 hypothetical protein EHI8A_246680 [Entamoeba histolytica HM-1:IMSS-B]EMS16220.1 hypothetical protein KM1_309350 [Entamoeba histolytica HM-3:IMSS]GAT93989.1 hypothetical protein CL6EHI_010270 [Entamoeba histolytica]EAL49437.1 hypothetical protein EHI_010270 [Entamoeba histolytica HM-1:IMSS]|eukprot:XP_654823.1 hypothetical protein EHI_010270 [Entamoeba histolytica HM-1:IMSS]
MHKGQSNSSDTESVVSIEDTEIDEIIQEMFPLEYLVKQRVRVDGTFFKVKYKNTILSLKQEILKFKEQHPIDLHPITHFSFSLAKSFLYDQFEYYSSTPNQETDINEILKETRESLVSYYRSMNLIFSTIQRQSPSNLGTFRVIICTSVGGIKRYLQSVHSLFRSSSKPVTVEYGDEVHPGDIILFGDELTENGTTSLLVFAWGCFEKQTELSYTVKVFSPINEFKVTGIPQPRRLFIFEKLTFSCCDSMKVAKYFFAHITAELMKIDSGSLTLTSFIEEPQFCTRCKNISNLPRSSCVMCHGCNRYYHEKCLLAFVSTNEAYCCKDCRNNSFIYCYLSNLLYPFRKMNRCLFCSQPFISEKELELRGVLSFTCSKCISQFQNSISSLYLRKCYSATNRKMVELYHKNKQLQNSPVLLLTYMFVLMSDIVSVSE